MYIYTHTQDTRGTLKIKDNSFGILYSYDCFACPVVSKYATANP